MNAIGSVIDDCENNNDDYEKNMGIINVHNSDSETEIQMVIMF